MLKLSPPAVRSTFIINKKLLKMFLFPSMQPRARILHTLWLTSMSGWRAWAWCCADRDSCPLLRCSLLTLRCWDATCVLGAWTSTTTLHRYGYSLFLYLSPNPGKEVLLQPSVLILLIININRTSCSFIKWSVEYVCNDSQLTPSGVFLSSTWIRKRGIDRSTIATVWSELPLTAPTFSPPCRKLQPSRRSTCWRGNQVCSVLIL